MTVALVAGRILLAAVFVAAGLAKLRDLPGSRRAMGEFGVPGAAAAVLGMMLPIAELAIAGALLAGPTAVWGALAALALLLSFCVAIAANLARGRKPDCQCFGQLHSAPVGGRTVVRNVALAAVAFFAAAELGSAEAAIALAGGGAVAMTAVLAVARLRQPGKQEGEPRFAEGLPIGAPAPGFRLHSFDGNGETLDSLRAPGLPVLLLFSDAECGPCAELAPDVSEWQREHAGELTIAVIERGRNGSGPTSPDEHGRRRVLIQRGSEVSDLYDAHGTPTAVLVGTDGAIASGVAGGRGQIEALVKRAVPAFEPRRPSSPPQRPVFGLPLRRRELLVRGAAAWAATSAALAWPLRAVAGIGPAARRAERCENRFDCPEHHYMDCENGRCVCGETAFDTPTTRCDPEEATDRRCFDLSRDKNHCGSCNHPCTGAPVNPITGNTRDVCCEGECGVAGETRCFCGDRACRPNEVCLQPIPGVVEDSVCFDCADDIEGPRRRCGNDCADPRTHRCCGNKLYRRDSLPPGDWRCCGPQHNRRLVNVDRSPNHCGGCNKRCARGQVCYGGKCRNNCPPGRPRCGGTCRNPRTEYCCGGSRVVQRSDADSNDRRCGPDCEDCHFLQRLTCCNGDCVNTGFDSRHCGGCNRPCPPPGTPSNVHCTCQGGGDRGCVCNPV